MERAPFGIDEWYHCFTRGIDKRRTFVTRIDYERFLGLLYVCNSSAVIHRSDLFRRTLSEIYEIERKDTLVGIGAFCLMPNHFHLLLREIREGGISAFMQKIGTAYTMYFNKKYDRIGNVFIGPYRSKHIHDDDYLQSVIQYIHCNPAEIFESGWKRGAIQDISSLETKLTKYPYSTFGAFQKQNHIFRRVLDNSIFEIETQMPPGKMLAEARDYYAEIEM
ncbi:MAG: transposase [bacterium]|nr:transposase [bacterium]